MRYVVKVEKVQRCEVSVEAENVEQAMKAVDMNARAGHYKHWSWYDSDVYAKDAELEEE
jgi:hypothetical protein